MGIGDWFKSGSKNLVGVDIGSSSVKVASIRRNGSQFVADGVGIRRLPEEAIVDGVIISKLPVAEAIEEIFAEMNLKQTRVATSISGHSVIVKKVTLPFLADSELDESIQWEAEQYIPFDISDVNIDYQVVRRSEDEQRIDVVLVAAKKDKITDYTSAVSMARKVPVVVDIDAFALQNIFEANYDLQPDTVYALFNIGSNVMNASILSGNQFLFTRDISVGGNQYTESLQQELHLTGEEAEAYKRGIDVPPELKDRVASILDAVTENISLEIEKTTDYFKTISDGKDISEIYLCGGASRTAGLRTYLSEKFKVPVEMLNPFKKIRLDNPSGRAEPIEETASEFAVAVGLALRAAQDR